MARPSKKNAAVAPAAAAATANAALLLPAELTIYTAGELHPQWLAWLQHAAAADVGVPAVLQAATVDQVDGAGLQLLLALRKSLLAQGRALQWQGASEPLFRAAAALGLVDVLGLAGLDGNATSAAPAAVEACA